jgi:thiosulfate dehydrogenase [quinone] large subunit
MNSIISRIGEKMRFNTSHSDEKIAYALLRAVAGMNLLMHGVSRMLAGPEGFAAHLTEQFAQSPLPVPLVRIFGSVLPPVEGLIGLLLLIGLKTRWALIASSLLMLVLTFGSALAQNWTAASTQLMYALVFSALLFLRRYNSWSVDGCWNKEQEDRIQKGL